MNTKNKKNKKLGLSELIWFGFNYTVGISFTAVFASLLLGATGGSNVGIHIIWIFLVEGLIAATCAWAFTRLSQTHSGDNGAAYIYIRSSYGRFWGWFVAFIQYSVLPIIVTSQIVSIIRINFTDPNSFLYANWGSWSNLGLDLIGVSIYALASCVLFFGIFAFKKFVNISSYIKWGTTLLLIIAVIVLFFVHGGSNYVATFKAERLTWSGFSKVFITCFFFFLGFETYATIGKNIKNPRKNIGLSIIIVMALSTLFYIFISIIMIGAIVGTFSTNPNLQIFNRLGSHFGMQWLSYAGIIIMLICTISLKANAGMQNALYSGGILEPLAVEGYISPRFKELNKDLIPFRAAILNLVITFLLVFFWLIIPDFIQGLSGSSSSVLDYGTITGEASLIMVIVYIMVLSVAIKLSIQKKITRHWIEIIIWSLVLVFMAWQLYAWFEGLYKGFSGAFSDLSSNVAKTHSQGIVELVSNIIQILYLLMVFTFIVVWYMLYYLPKLKLRLANNTQKILDYKFKISNKKHNPRMVNDLHDINITS